MAMTWPVTQPGPFSGKEQYAVGDVRGLPEPPHRDAEHEVALALPGRSSPTARWVVGLDRMKPGAMQLTVIPNGPSSCAICRVKPI